jgi:hypothetical protein
MWDGDPPCVICEAHTAIAELAALKGRAHTCDTCQFQRDDEHVGEPCCTISLTWIPCRVLGNRCGAWAKK